MELEKEFTPHTQQDLEDHGEEQNYMLNQEK